MQWGVSMQRPRMVESKDLLDWEAEGLTTAEMQTRLADEGKTVSIELVRLRLREARQEAPGRTAHTAEGEEGQCDGPAGTLAGGGGGAAGTPTGRAGRSD